MSGYTQNRAPSRRPPVYPREQRAFSTNVENATAKYARAVRARFDAHRPQHTGFGPVEPPPYRADSVSASSNDLTRLFRNDRYLNRAAYQPGVGNSVTWAYPIYKFLHERRGSVGSSYSSLERDTLPSQAIRSRLYAGDPSSNMRFRTYTF